MARTKKQHPSCEYSQVIYLNLLTATWHLASDKPHWTLSDQINSDSVQTERQGHRGDRQTWTGESQISGEITGEQFLFSAFTSSQLNNRVFIVSFIVSGWMVRPWWTSAEGTVQHDVAQWAEEVVPTTVLQYYSSTVVSKRVGLTSQDESGPAHTSGERRRLVFWQVNERLCCCSFPYMVFFLFHFSSLLNQMLSTRSVSPVNIYLYNVPHALRWLMLWLYLWCCVWNKVDLQLVMSLISKMFPTLFTESGLNLLICLLLQLVN